MLILKQCNLRGGVAMGPLPQQTFTEVAENRSYHNHVCSPKLMPSFSSTNRIFSARNLFGTFSPQNGNAGDLLENSIIGMLMLGVALPFALNGAHLQVVYFGGRVTMGPPRQQARKRNFRISALSEDRSPWHRVRTTLQFCSRTQ